MGRWNCRGRGEDRGEGQGHGWPVNYTSRKGKGNKATHLEPAVKLLCCESLLGIVRLARRGVPHGVTKRPRVSALGHVKVAALVLVAIDVHNVLHRQGLFHAHGEGVGLSEVGTEAKRGEAVSVAAEHGAEGGDCESKYTPDPARARKGCGVAVVAVNARKVELSVRRLPKVIALCHLLHIGRSHEVSGVGQVQLRNDELIGHSRDVVIGDALCYPDGAATSVIRQHVEHPRLLWVAHRQCLPGFVLRELELTVVFAAVKAVLDGQVAHGLDGAARRVAALQSNLRQSLHVHEGSAPGRAHGRGNKFARARALAHRHLLFILKGIGAQCVCVRVRDLLNIPDGLAHGPVVYARVDIFQKIIRAVNVLFRRLHVARIRITNSIHGTHAARRPITRRHVRHSKIALLTVIIMRGHSATVGHRLRPHANARTPVCKLPAIAQPYVAICRTRTALRQSTASGVNSLRALRGQEADQRQEGNPPHIS